MAHKEKRTNQQQKIPVRSVRVPDAAWEKARRRANFEGVTMSYVVQMIMEGYADGKVNLPRITKDYSNTVTAVGERAPARTTTSTPDGGDQQ